MVEQRRTHFEHVGDGYHVVIQYCEFEDENSIVCNEYLGVNYPSTVCAKHRSTK